VGATPQSGWEDKSDYELAISALLEAVKDSGLSLRDVDGLVAAGGSIQVQEMARLLGMAPTYTGSMDYNAGPFAVLQACALVSSGICDVVACAYGVNPGAGVGKASGYNWILDAPHGYVNVNGIAGLMWTEYLSRHHSSEELLGRIALNARSNARLNPIAPTERPLSMEEYLNQEYVFWPLREADIAVNNAGGAALIVTTAERARDLRDSNAFVHGFGRAETPGTFELDGHLQGVGMNRAAKQVFAKVGIGPSDIDVLGVSDATTVAVVQALEGYGFCDEGGAEDFVLAGSVDRGGSLPLNPDGGHLGGGYLIGWLQQIELVRQMRHEAGERQVAEAQWALHSATGGARERYLGVIYGADS
jgi:acetyl-CoA acetyltransferase